MNRAMSKTIYYGCCVSALMLAPAARAATDEAAPAGPAPAATQDGSAADSSREEIIVTATRREQALQDVPASINVVTSEDLQKFNLFDTRDIARLAPGLDLNTTGRLNTTTLRGITFNPDSGGSPTVQFYYNEVPVNAQTIFEGLYDVGQIEVLRGAQGLLRGLSAPAGSILIGTRRPTFDAPGADGTATVTEHGAYNVQLASNLPFSDSFAIRAALLVDRNRGNFVRNVTDGERSGRETMSARLTLGWQPSADFTAYLMYQYLHSDTIDVAQVYGPGAVPGQLFGGTLRSGPAIALDDRLGVADQSSRYLNESHIVSLNLEWDLGFATLGAIGGYQDTRLHSVIDGDGTNAVPGFIDTALTIAPYIVKTGELRLTSNDDGPFGWGIGAFYTKQTGDVLNRTFNTTFFAPFPFSAGQYFQITADAFVPVNSQTASFNASARYTLGAFTLEGGLRYTIDTKDRTTNVRITGPGIDFLQEGVPARLRKQRDEYFSGGATLTFEASPDLTLYGSYNRSVRGGSVGVAVPLGLSEDLLVTDLEKTDSFELGIKGALIDRRLTYSITGFYQKFDNFLGRFGASYNCPNLPAAFGGGCGPVPPATPINNATDSPGVDGFFEFNYGADATSKGVEGSLNLRATDFWDLGINASYTRARYDSGARLPCNDYDGDGRPDTNGTPRVTGTGNVSFCARDRLADVPDFSINGNTELRIPVGGSVQPFIRSLITYRPRFQSTAGQFVVPSTTLINLHAGLRSEDGKWELQVFARNLLDQQRILGQSDSNVTRGTAAGPTLVYDSGYRTVTYQAPREVGVTAQFRF